jgi:methionine synthase II (cobalamin-independent)
LALTYPESTDQTISIHLTRDGYRFFSTTRNQSLKGLFSEHSLYEAFNKFIDEQEDTKSLKLIYTSTNTLVAEEFFKKDKAANYLKFQLRAPYRSAYNEIRSAGIYNVFEINTEIEADLKEKGIDLTISHSATELIKRALATPDKSQVRVVSIFHEDHFELVIHKGSELYGYHQFPIRTAEEVNYYLTLIHSQTPETQNDFDLICYDYHSEYGKEAVKKVAQWVDDLQYITEIFPFI